MTQAALLHVHYKATEVIASILIAAVASYSAFTLAERVGAPHRPDRLQWLVGGGMAMGLGIVAMHFVGALAMSLPVSVGYELGRTSLSVLVAVAGSILALRIASGHAMGRARLAFGAVAFGGAIAGMHYIGMSAIRGPVAMTYDVPRVVLSVFVAIGVAAVALVLVFHLRTDNGTLGTVRRLSGAVVMGLAVAGMHYTAMWAMQLHAGSSLARVTPFDGRVVGDSGAAAWVITASIMLLVAAIVASLVDRHALRELRDTQRTLEFRIAEHEAEAAMATELYCLLAEHATDMLSTHKPDGTFTYATTSWSEFTGLPIDHIVGHFPIELAHPDDVQLLMTNHARGLQAPEMITTEWRCRRATAGTDVAYAWVETSTRPVREAMSGRVQTFVCATRDVSERRRMQDQLARSEARLRAALDGSFDSFFALDAVRDESGHIVDFVYSEVNPRAELLIARARSDVLGRRMTELFPSSAKTHLEKFSSVVQAQQPLDEEMEVVLDGAKRWFHHQIIPLGDGVAVTTRDVTDRKAAEEELRALTLVDDLTTLYNRRGFNMLVDQHLRLSKRGGPASLLFCIDLDYLKTINDAHGHAEGDAALRRVADVLRSAFRDSDILARFGGDEFVVFALDCGEFREHLIGRLEAALDASNASAARPYTLSFSIGTARFDPLAPVPLDVLMAEADANLYRAKRSRAPRPIAA